MTVNELIEKLQELPKNQKKWRVILNDEYGFRECESIESIEKNLDMFYDTEKSIWIQ